ncbi:unnamed protein product [Lactuca virosa]|uniref:Uncharacterized protein n=1 Tax=Lactuca virosa TaxID=75947 RepID=A0AAU9P9N3_9ASTR|nr:unnamed protein product [Lactuca virosa]
MSASSTPTSSTHLSHTSFINTPQAYPNLHVRASSSLTVTINGDTFEVGASILPQKLPHLELHPYVESQSQGPSKPETFVAITVHHLLPPPNQAISTVSAFTMNHTTTILTNFCHPFLVLFYREPHSGDSSFSLDIWDGQKFLFKTIDSKPETFATIVVHHLLPPPNQAYLYRFLLHCEPHHHRFSIFHIHLPYITENHNRSHNFRSH